MFSNLRKPKFPSTGIAIGETSVSVARTESTGNGIRLRDHAEVSLPSGSVSADFSGEKTDFIAIADAIRECAERAGIADKKSWGLALPHASAKIATFTLDNDPKSEGELKEILEWKASTAFGFDVDSLRLASDRISNDIDGKIRHLVTAVTKNAIHHYEEAVQSIGWNVGLVLPRTIAEASVLRGFQQGDSLLLSFSKDGFNGMVLRGKDPLIVRNVTCSEEEIADELYRLMLFYSDRFEDGQGSLSRLLATGAGFDSESLADVCAEALGYGLEVVTGRLVSGSDGLVHSESAFAAIGVSSVGS